MEMKFFAVITKVETRNNNNNNNNKKFFFFVCPHSVIYIWRS